MGQRGPARKPVEQRRRTSRSATKDNAGRPLPDRATVTVLPGTGNAPPPLPATVLDDGPGAARWAKVWTVARAWVSPDTDIAIVTRLCEAEDMRQAMREDLDRVGFMVEGSMGQQRPNPLIDKLRALDDQMTRYEQQLGLTPSARGSLGVAEVGEARAESALERYMREAAEKRQRVSKRS